MGMEKGRKKGWLARNSWEHMGGGADEERGRKRRRRGRVASSPFYKLSPGRQWQQMIMKATARSLLLGPWEKPGGIPCKAAMSESQIIGQ